MIGKKWLLILLIVCGLNPSLLSAQQDSRGYEFLPAPDIWYNDVDGIRVGVRVKGQTSGSFDDGPHRLDFGVWLGTWIPDYPVSYYFSLTEPIPSLSAFGSEANVQLISSFRTGYQQHGVAFNKRWQTGFNEQNYKRISFSFQAEERFEQEYLQYPQLWDTGWLYLISSGFTLQQDNKPGLFRVETDWHANVAGPFPSFVSGNVEMQQLWELNDYFALRLRGYGAVASADAASQYLYSRSFKPAIGWMEKGLTRAKGTIPQPWMTEGIFQVSGGANLRGYISQETEVLNRGFTPQLSSIGALNVELDYPNPLDKAIQKIPVLGSILRLRSYLFFDSGTSLGLTGLEEDRTLSDGGLGFMLSLNIPDYLGHQRGIMLRYDIPLWLSHPEDNNHFKYRNVIGIGAIISL